MPARLITQLTAAVRKAGAALGLRAPLNAAIDAWRFSRARNVHARIAEMRPEQAASHLLRTMHSLEKGLAMPEPSPGFGREKAGALIADAESYRKIYGEDRVFRMCMAVLADYAAYRQRRGESLDGLDIDRFAALAQGQPGGARETTRAEIWERSRIDFARFAESRSSIRMFTGEPVPEADIRAAIAVAAKSPSVCNRACARAWHTTDPALMKRLLDQQFGSRGFGHLAGGLVIVTADMQAFYKTGERYQGWIDGGLFAMSLNYALHAQGYGVCMLNWSMDALHDRRFRKAFGIPDSQLVVMMMAIGHIPERLQVAVSPRRDLSAFALSLDRPAGARSPEPQAPIIAEAAVAVAADAPARIVGYGSDHPATGTPEVSRNE